MPGRSWASPADPAAEGEPPGSHWSVAFRDIPAPDFADVQIVAIPGKGSISGDPRSWAAEVFSVRSAPVWVRGLLAVRQAAVGVIGIEKGDQRVFDIDEVTSNEALIAHDDTHLDFRAAVGVDVANRLLRVTTAVRLHGWRGRVYWAVVSLLHGPVTRSMAKRAVRRLV